MASNAKPKQFKAKIVAINVRNGIVTFKLLHLGLDYTKMCFELYCGNNKKRVVFDSKKIATTPYKLIYARVPLDLYDYTMSFKLRVKFTERVYNAFAVNVWFDYTPMELVEIQSSLIPFHYKKNDVIQYRPENMYSEQDGYITNILSGDKTGYFEVTNCDDIDQKTIVHKSKLISVPISFVQILDFQNKLKIDKYLLSQSRINAYMIDKNNRNAFNIFQILLLFFETFVAMHINHVRMEEYSTIARYFGVNIIQYLFENDLKAIKYKTQCLKDGCNGYILKLSSLRNYSYLTYIDGIKLNLKPTNPQSDDCIYTCDVCMISVSNYDYMYHCNATDITNRHDICIYCVYNLMQRHEELLILLQDILIEFENLNFDCIQEIAGFVTGNDVVGAQQ